MQQRELSEIVDGRIWAQERPVWFGGVRLRARTSVIRLDDGRLLVHSPAPPSDALRKELTDLGEVSWLVVPNCFHHLGAPAAAAAFPKAKLVGPNSAAVRNSALRIDLDIRDPLFAETIPELAVVPLHGVPFLDETLLYHRPTENFATCVVVDFAAARKRPKQRAAGQRLDPRERAVEWLRQLEEGEVASRAALARREGLSRARVSQVLNQSRGAVARRQRAG